MKKLFNLTLITSLLYSQMGCVGETANNAFPYATAEIKQKLAKSINSSLTVVPDNFFETFDYATPDYDWDPIVGISNTQPDYDWNQIVSVLDTQEEKWFWNELINMRSQMINMTIMLQGNISLSDRAISPQVLSSVISYEEAHPYTPDLKKIDKGRDFLIGMALGNLPHPPREEEIQAYIEGWGGRDTAKLFHQVREKILQYYKEALAVRQSGKTPEDYATAKKSKMGITKYAVQMQAPTLYPAELIIASFGLSEENEDAVYMFPKISLKNVGPSSHYNIRIENEKPLPYNLTLVWYSIAENKNYIMKTDLPRQALIAKLMGDSDRRWNSLLVTLAPYGQVTLYVYNQITGKKEQLARYQAQEHLFSADELRQMDMMYQSSETPAADWKEYQQMALANFPQAAKNLKNNGLPEKDPSETTYWDENPPKRVPIPSKEEINNMNQDGFTPLVDAVRSNQESLMSRLIAAGADVNIPASATGETPLEAAVSMGYLQMAEELLAAGADINLRNIQSSYTPLMSACISGNEEAVKLLLKAGADVNARVIAMGQTLNENALSIALNNNFPQIATLLRQAGAEELSEEDSVIDPAAIEEAYKTMAMTPLHTALAMGDTDKIQELIHQGADVNTDAPNVGTPLLYACTVGNLEAARMLIAAKADVNIAGNTGYTPLLMACQTGNAELVKLLISAGADTNVKHVVNGQETGLTPLKIAQDYGFAEIAQMLTQAGAK